MLGIWRLFRVYRLEAKATALLIERRFEESEFLLQRALALAVKVDGHEGYNVGPVCYSLAMVYVESDRQSEAEVYLQRAFSIFENHHLIADPVLMINAIGTLGQIHINKKEYGVAATLFERVIEIQNTYNLEVEGDIKTLNALGLVYHAQENYETAESYHRRALSKKEKALGPDHPDVSVSLNSLAETCIALRRFDEARSLYKRAIAILDKSIGLEDEAIVTPLKNYASLLRDTGRDDEAEEMEARIRSIVCE